MRAVGLANGSNPIAIIIPCHRVIGSNGSLTGYGGGLPIKQALLALERGQGRLSEEAFRGSEVSEFRGSGSGVPEFRVPGSELAYRVRNPRNLETSNSETSKSNL